MGRDEDGGEEMSKEGEYRHQKQEQIVDQMRVEMEELSSRKRE